MSLLKSPELRRNLWLELTPVRLVLMPAVLLLVFALVYTLADEPLLALSGAAGFLFVMVTVLWGANLAAGNIGEELMERTWDWQRMSSITPAEITFGKLIGGPIYAWYGGLICLVVYVIAGLLHDSSSSAFWIATLVGAALAAHASAMIVSAIAIGKYSYARQARAARVRGALTLLVGLFLFGFISSISTRLHGELDWGVTWYGGTFAARPFILISLYVFTAWAILGLYRVFRAELRFRNGPWVAGAFHVYLMVYVAGFVNTSSEFVPDRFTQVVDSVTLARLSLAAWIGALLTIFGMLHERHDPVSYRALLGGNRPFPSHLLPRWGVSLALTTLVLAPLALLTGLGTFAAVALACWLYLVRDVLVILALNLRPNGKPADALALLYLAVVYGILPGITQGGNLFLPNPEGPLPSVLISPLAQAMAAAVFLHYRWRRLYGAPN